MAVFSLDFWFGGHIRSGASGGGLMDVCHSWSLPVDLRGSIGRVEHQFYYSFIMVISTSTQYQCY